MRLPLPQERLLTPPHWIELDESLPLAFIAGPVQGAPDYQTQFAANIITVTEDTFIASPRRTELDEAFVWEQQVKWERANLARAAFNGVQAFFLAARDHDLPYEEGRAYAQTTRFEFADAIKELIMLKRFKSERVNNVQIGIDPAYSRNGGGSERYFRYLAQEAGLQVCNSLDELSEASLQDIQQ